MKKIILVAITVLFISTPAFAGQSTWDYVYTGSNSGNQDNNQPSDNNNTESRNSAHRLENKIPMIQGGDDFCVRGET